MSEPVIQVEKLTKNYGAVAALRGVSFEVQPAKCSDCSVPNGAGKDFDD